MSSIIDELLMLSSVRTEEITLQELDMAEIITEAEARLSHQITTYRTKLTIPDVSDWPVVLGYGPWVEEVWANYISNAIKYGGQPPKVELGATPQSDGTVHFWVRDNGDGLTPEEQEKLFIPFTRLNQARAEGHGLGLSIVQRIVEKLGGRVSVESSAQPGQGCTFGFYLPAQTTAP